MKKQTLRHPIAIIKRSQTLGCLLSPNLALQNNPPLTDGSIKRFCYTWGIKTLRVMLGNYISIW